MRLGKVFLAARGDGRDPGAPVRLEEALRRAIVDARAAWPSVTVDEEDFVRHLAVKIGRDEDPATVLSRMHVIDVYLACACMRGDARALALFEEHFVSPVAAQLARRPAFGGFDDEAKQLLRTRLLVADNAPPRIGEYNGSGSLRGWLYIAASRLALNLRRSEDALAESDLADDLGDAGVDPEIEYLKRRYGAEVEDALRASVSTLPARDANLLGLHYLDGLPSEAIAPMYGVSPRTVYRWVVEARQRVVDQLRRNLSERLALSEAELDSLFAFVRSRVVLTMRRYLER